LWNEIKLILPEKSINNTIGRPSIPFRKVLDGIIYVQRTGCQWKMLPKEYGSGSSTCHRRFQQWIVSSDVFQKLWIKLLGYHDELIIGIRWKNGNRLIIVYQ
jgi:transposase